MVITEAKDYVTSLVSARISHQWVLNELYFLGQPNLIGEMRAKYTHNGQIGYFGVRCGIRKGRPRCWILSPIAKGYNSFLGMKVGNLSKEHENQIMQEIHMFSASSDRAAKRPNPKSNTILWATIRRCPTIFKGYTIVYSLSVGLCPFDRCEGWVAWCLAG